MQMTDERPVEEAADDIEFGGDFIPHPAGEFKAVFTHATVFEKEYDGQKKKRLKLHFQTEEEMPNGDPFGITAITAPSFNAKGKVRPLLTALGEDVNKLKPAEFKIKDYYGKKLRLFIVHEQKQDGTGIFAKISAFLPLKAAAASGGKKKPNFEEEDE